MKLRFPDSLGPSWRRELRSCRHHPVVRWEASQGSLSLRSWEHVPVIGARIGKVRLSYWVPAYLTEEAWLLFPGVLPRIQTLLCRRRYRWEPGLRASNRVPQTR